MYATVEEANARVAAFYSSTDPLRISWEGQSAADKQVLLNRAEQFLDLLPLKGKALEHDKAFPREPSRERSLEMAKIATIELAVQTLDKEANERLELQKQGVKAYRIGDLSETFGAAKGVTNFGGLNDWYYSIVLPYLHEWLGGGYRICPTHRRW